MGKVGSCLMDLLNRSLEDAMVAAIQDLTPSGRTIAGIGLFVLLMKLDLLKVLGGYISD